MSDKPITHEQARLDAALFYPQTDAEEYARRRVHRYITEREAAEAASAQEVERLRADVAWSHGAIDALRVEVSQLAGERDEARRVAADYIARTDPILARLESLSDDLARVTAERDEANDSLDWKQRELDESNGYLQHTRADLACVTAERDALRGRPGPHCKKCGGPCRASLPLTEPAAEVEHGTK